MLVITIAIKLSNNVYFVNILANHSTNNLLKCVMGDKLHYLYDHDLCVMLFRSKQLHSFALLRISCRDEYNASKMHETQDAYPDCIRDSIAREHRVGVKPAPRRFRHESAVRHLSHDRNALRRTVK